MGFRKIISFGKSSCVMSLPKEWMKKNHLKKGDFLFVDSSHNNLIVSPEEIIKKEDGREVVLDISGKDDEIIQKRIFSEYINDFSKIIIKGNNLREKLETVRAVIQDLMAVEIVEQSRDKIVAQNFLNLEEIETDDIIKKIDVILREMLKDTKDCAGNDVSESIVSRDRDINRLSFLVFKQIKYVLRNKAHKVNVSKVMNHWMVSFHLEKIGDQTKRIARFISDIQKEKNWKRYEKNVCDLLSKILEFYKEALKIFYTQDKEKGFEFLERTIEIYSYSETLILENSKCARCVQLADKSKEMINHIDNIVRSVCEVE